MPRRAKVDATPKPTRPYPDGLLELWVERDRRAFPRDIATRFALYHLSEYPRKLEDIDGKTAEPGWWDMGLHFVGTFRVADSDRDYWLICDTAGWWRVYRLKS